MKNLSYSLPGLAVRRTVSGSPPTTTTTNFIQTRFSKVVQSGPIIHGDHKSPNPWSFTIGDRSSNAIVASYGKADGSYTDYWTGNSFSYMVTENLVTWGSEDAQLASAAAYSDLVEAIRGSIDLSIDFAQASQTLATPSQMKTIISGYWKAFRSSGLSKTRFLTTLMKQTGSSWLLFRYGIQPTMQTVYGVAQFLTNHYAGRSTTFEGRGSISRSVTVDVPNWPDSTGWMSQATVNTTTRVQYKVRLHIPDSTTTALARLSSLNPASIAWELLPWSFVIDWLFSIGDYLRGLETSVLYSRYFSDGFKSVSFRSSVKQVSKRSGVPPAGIVWSGSYSADGNWKSNTRYVLSVFPPVPLPTVTFHNLGSGRLLNAAALLTTFLR